MKLIIINEMTVGHWLKKAKAAKKRGSWRMQMDPDFAISALEKLLEFKKLQDILGDEKVQYILSQNE